MTTTAGKKTWIKPTFKPHVSGGLNKMGRVRAAQHVGEVDGVGIPELLKTYGSPLFVLSERRLRQNCRRIHRLFSNRYAKVIQAWSYKTNYLGAVCNTLHQEGAWAEVVSGFEYEKARALGVPGRYILFNGPAKSRNALTRAVTEGAHIHIDHDEELRMLTEIGKERGISIPVTMRLNFDTGHAEPWSRFGFNVENGEALEAARRIDASGVLRLTGLHSHIGTFILDPRAYAQQVRIMCAFMDAVESGTGATIETFDIGGGFASKNALQGVYLPPEQVIPTPEQYADALCDTLTACTHDRQARGVASPTLILETGRAVVDDAMVLLSSVVANKRLADGRRGVVLDAGVNLLFTAFWYNHEVHPTRPLPGTPEEMVLFGPLCMNIDVMRQQVTLPPLEVGDALMFSPVGAYNNTQWLQFIEYRPNVVIVREDGGHEVIRAAETLQTVIAQERLPAHLRSPAPKGEGGWNTQGVAEDAPTDRTRDGQ